MNHYKKFKQYLKFFEDNNNSAEYLQHLDNRKLSIEQYINEQIKRNPGKNDYYYASNPSFVSYYIYDFLTNEDIVKVIDNLDKLPNEEYDVDCHFRRSSKSVKYNYVQLEYSHSRESFFADICFKKDKFIDHIHMTCTQVNNYYMMLEYEFIFKHVLNSQEALNEFLYSNMKKIGENDFYIYFDCNMNSPLKHSNMISFKKMMLPMVMQHFVTSLSFSPNGKYYKLNSLQTYTRDENINLDDFILCDDRIYYYNKTDNYFIEHPFNDDTSYSMLCGNKKIARSPLISLFSMYGNEAYYLLFGYQDLKMFENKYNSQLQGTKKIELGSNLFELITKVHSVSDFRQDDYKAMNTEINSKWEFYPYGKKEEINIDKSRVSYYRRIYSQNLEVIKMRAEINNVKGNSTISKWALAIAIISIIVAIALGIIQICI